MRLVVGRGSRTLLERGCVVGGVDIGKLIVEKDLVIVL